jgi:lysophospholipase L1-like esterase
MASYTFAGIKIVVLGSSTAAGSGPVNISNSWVNRYSTYLRSLNAANTVVNLAKGGTVTFQAMPTDYVPPTGITYLSDSLHNITKALSLSPNAIIINFPSNDVSNGISIDQQIANYNVMIAKAKEVNVPVWICTSQPVNYGTSQTSRDKIKALKERIQAEYKDMSIDFYTGLCDNAGKILTQYDSGDGLHLNDDAHAILYQRVKEANIFTKINYDPETGTQLLQNPILIDFGTDISPAPWNNITNNNANGIGSKVDNLKDFNALSTGISIEVSKSFYGLNTYGSTITNTNLNMPSSVSSDNFYTGGGFGELLLTGFSTNQIYTFTFFGSRTEFGGQSRETKFTVKGNSVSSGLLETLNNSSKVLILSGIKSASNKSITIEVTDGPANQNSSKYSHISALKIMAETLNAVDEQKLQCFSVWNNNGKIFASFAEKGTIEIYNLTGKLIYTRRCLNSSSENVELKPTDKGILIVLFKSDAGKIARKVVF